MAGQLGEAYTPQGNNRKPRTIYTPGPARRFRKNGLPGLLDRTSASISRRACVI